MHLRSVLPASLFLLHVLQHSQVSSAMRNSSTKGRHIVLTTPALQKGEPLRAAYFGLDISRGRVADLSSQTGQACRTCKERKVRCSGQVAGEAACDSCKRLARFLGNDEGAVVCCFEGKRGGGRRKRAASSQVKHEEVEHQALPPAPMEQASQQSSAELCEFSRARYFVDTLG